MVERFWHMKAIAFLISCLALAACTAKKPSESARVRLTMPSNKMLGSQKSSSVGAQSSPWDEMCYFVNVTGGSLSASKENACEIPKGVTTSSFLEPGSSISLDLARSNSSYTLQIIGYVRSSSAFACPKLNSAKQLAGLDQSKLFQIGSTAFMADEAEKSVTVNVQSPSVTLQSQYVLGSGCVSGLPTVSIANTNVAEGTGNGTTNMTFTLTMSRSSDSTVYVPYATGTGTATAGTDYTATAGTLTISAGTTTSTITVPVIRDAVAESDETVVMTLSSGEGFTSTGSTLTATGTIVDDDGGGGSTPTPTLTPTVTPTPTPTPAPPGTFTINGVKGGSDITEDAFLNTTTYPTIAWSTSSGAIAYDVQIYQNDGTTTVGCGLATDVAAVFYNFSMCALTAGTNYKVRVTAKNSGGGSIVASNSLYTFKVNQAPVAVDDGPYLVISNGGSVTLSVRSDNLASGPNDPDADADGDTLTISSTTNGSKGTVSTDGSSVTYTVSGANRGADSFQYTISDGSGGTSTATVSMMIMTPYTWTGDVADNAWSTGGNWCGSLNANKTACAGSVTAPTASDIAYFDGTCSGSKCNATINTNASVMGLVIGDSYANVVSMSGGYTLTVGPVGFLINDGIFAGASGNIAVNGPTKLYGGTITATMGEWSSYDWDVLNYPSFNHNNGRVKVGGKGATLFVSVGLEQYYDWEFADNSGYAFDLAGMQIEILGQLDFNAPGSPLDNGAANAEGNINIYGISGGTGTISSTGSNTRTIMSSGGIDLPDFYVASSGGGIATLSGQFDLGGNFSWGGGGFDAGASTMKFTKLLRPDTTITLVGNVALNNVIIQPAFGGKITLASPGGVNINNLTINYSAGSAFYMSSIPGDYFVNGTYYVNCTGNCIPGSSAVYLSGPTGQVWTQSTGRSPFFAVVVSKPVTDTVELNGGAATYDLTGYNTILGTNFPQSVGVSSGILNLNGKNLLLNDSNVANDPLYMTVGASGVVNFVGTETIDTEYLTNDGVINKNGGTLTYGTLVGGGTINP